MTLDALPPGIVHYAAIAIDHVPTEAELPSMLRALQYSAARPQFEERYTELLREIGDAPDDDWRHLVADLLSVREAWDDAPVWACEYQDNDTWGIVAFPEVELQL